LLCTSVVGLQAMKEPKKGIYTVIEMEDGMIMLQGKVFSSVDRKRDVVSFFLSGDKKNLLEVDLKNLDLALNRYAHPTTHSGEELLRMAGLSGFHRKFGKGLNKGQRINDTAFDCLVVLEDPSDKQINSPIKCYAMAAD